MSTASKARFRRGWPIHGYVGPNGSGKSATAVLDTIPSLRAGRRVLSTVRLLDFERPRPCEGFQGPPGDEIECTICAGVRDPEGLVYAHRQAHPLWIPFREWHQLLEAERVDVIMDEVTGVASSRESAGLPPAVANTLVQMRRRDVVVRWTAPAWARADKIIRECSQAVTYCTGYFPKSHRDGDRAWRNRRLSVARTFDAAVFEDFTAGKREQLRHMAQSVLWLPRAGVFEAYDSFDAVLTIGTVSEGGTCERCGGRRARPACRCESGEPHGGGDAGPARSVGASAPTRGRRIARQPVGTTTPGGDTPPRVRAVSGAH